MKLANRSKLSVYAGVFSGDLPLSVEKRVLVTNNSGNLPSAGERFHAAAWYLLGHDEHLFRTGQTFTRDPGRSNRWSTRQRHGGLDRRFTDFCRSLT